jgi:hypothetical protein
MSLHRYWRLRHWRMGVLFSLSSVVGTTSPVQVKADAGEFFVKDTAETFQFQLCFFFVDAA